jgi:ubiquinone/menaquinone biosynthesis C-methylase UbiE
LKEGDSKCCARKKALKKNGDEAADAWMDFVREGKDHYRDGLNNPAALKLIGNIKDKTILDLACGEGYNTRILSRLGAKAVGVDFSKKMIELARQEEKKEKLNIRYYVLDACSLKEFPSNHFDIATCFMVLQDIEHYKEAIAEVARVLKSEGRFVFSIPHPCFETITLKGKRVSALERYFGTVKYPINWDMKRLSKPFLTSSFHRTLTDYFNAIHKNKLFVSGLVEPRPTLKEVRKHPQLKEVRTRPQSIIVECIKIAVK